jgi:RND superfamily putative drug exporter
VLVAGLWLALLVVSVPLAARQTEHLTGGGFEVPGSGSAAVAREMERFSGVSSDPLAVLLRRGAGDAAALRRAVDRVDRAAAKIAHVELEDAAAAEARARTARSAVVIVPVRVDGGQDASMDAAVALRDELGVGRETDGVQPYLVGQQALWAGMLELQKEDLARAEGAGFPAILIVLLAVFGSVLAALLPVGLGVAAVTVTGAAVYALALVTPMSIFVTNVASMLGIGVAVDYSLFLLARYREELARGAGRDDALDAAMRTSGVTVVFSGTTVVISLAGLFLLDSTVMRSMAIGAIVVVAIAVLGAVTLLPALIALLGERLERPGRIVSATGALARRVARRPATGRRAPDPRGGFWRRRHEQLMRRPALSATLVAGVLVALAAPALSLHLGDGALRQFPTDHETRRGAELAAREISPGAASPTFVVASLTRGSVASAGNRAALERYAERLRTLPGVAAVTGPQGSGDGRAALLAVVARRDPESREAQQLVDRLRADGGRAVGLDRRARVSVGGAAAQLHDFSNLIAGGLWKILAFVVICTYLLLLLVLRSVLLPLQAVVMNLLSVGAAYGVLVAVFQHGWLDGVTGLESLGYINAVTPPLLLAVVFGLSMDYEVFLLSRIRERYLATGDNSRAVAEGLQASAKVITSAAVIMIVVFGVFALTGVPQIQEIGIGLAVAIAVDATLVRLVLVPATMELLGPWNWWLPQWLERVLPEIGVESEQAAGEERAPAAA